MASLPSLRLARFSFAWRLGFLYAALFLVVGCYLPYLPIWLHWRSLDADQIAVLLATPLFTRILFTPAISFAADRLGDRRTILIALAWGSLLSFLLLWAADGFWHHAARHRPARHQLDHDHAADRDRGGEPASARARSTMDGSGYGARSASSWRALARA